jgi:hypothetical protein
MTGGKGVYPSVYVSLNFHGVAIGWGLWSNNVDVKKPELVIQSTSDAKLLRGECSACPHTLFHSNGNTTEHKARLRQMFDLHFKQVHMREDAAKPGNEKR